MCSEVVQAFLYKASVPECTPVVCGYSQCSLLKWWDPASLLVDLLLPGLLYFITPSPHPRAVHSPLGSADTGQNPLADTITPCRVHLQGWTRSLSVGSSRLPAAGGMHQQPVSSGLAERVCSPEEAVILVLPLLCLLWGVCTLPKAQ